MQWELLVGGPACPMDAPRPPIWTTPLSAMADTRLEINDHKALLQQLQAAAR